MLTGRVHRHNFPTDSYSNKGLLIDRLATACFQSVLDYEKKNVQSSLCSDLEFIPPECFRI